MRMHRIRAAAALLVLVGSGLLAGCGGGRGPAGGTAGGPSGGPSGGPHGDAVAGGAGGPVGTGAAADGPGGTLPLEPRPGVLRCADAVRSMPAPAPTFLHVEGLASDGWGALGVLPDIGPVSAGGRQYRFVTAFLHLTPQSAPETSISVVSPAEAWLYYTDLGTWAGGNPLVPPVPHGPSKQVRVGACPDDGRPAGYPGGILIPGPTCVTLRFVRSDTRTGQDATFRYGVPTC